MNKEINQEFFQANQYFLSDYFAGKIKVSPINILKINNSTYNLNNRFEVEVISTSTKINPKTEEEETVTTKTRGFISSFLCRYKDDLDIINSEIASLLDIKASNVYRLLTPTSITGTLSINTRQDNTDFLLLSSLLNEFYRQLKYQNNEIPDYLKSFQSYHFSKENPVRDIDIIKNIIDLPLAVISDSLNPSLKDFTKITGDYIKTLLFNYLTNQSIYNLDNYSILINNNSKEISLSPIYDYNNELENNNIISLNNQYIDKSSLLETLYTYYYPQIKSLSRGLSENLSAYKTSIEMIVNHQTTKEYAGIILKNIFNNLDHISKFELEENNFGESKIDMVLTQTSINLSAVNQNTLVRNKYKTIEVTKEEIKPIIPKEKSLKKNNNHQVLNVIIFIICLIFICLIGIGVAYLIFHLNFLDY